VQHLDGSTTARQRLQVILETLSGQCRVQEACQRLGVCEQRFHQLREEALAAALARLEPGLPGRPPRPVTPAEQEVETLTQQLAARELELRAARAREEIALTLPRVVLVADSAAPASPPPPTRGEKKTRRRRRRPPGTRKPT
jgi:hypothetical protein